ncbi:hypothetical protein HYH38_16105 [Clostridium botulinum]|uniref:Lipoprotein n=1 Tax=Clostridium botulinum TaxID=1491 RepID=A0A126JIH6_CLOBO|nr:hypothetical protein [Clostridium botulinum]ALT05453.1 hypothetical protein [Clostridium botulinum]ALT05551.1 hypothetical protein [Clostridium botulinum]MBY6810987.1 hypothetical protein [Clostridium botulinum]MBY6818464.1 hypothetical protein [Clostridium botulinum]MBY6824455.1 hypothetical protein [Clostridium botulinum]
MYKRLSKLIRSLLLIILIFCLSGCTHNDTIIEAEIKEGTLISFDKSNGNYEFSFTDDNNILYSNKNIKLNSKIEINDNLNDREIKVYYEIKNIYKVTVKNGKTINKELIEQYKNITSDTKIILNMNKNTYNNSI